MKQTTPWEGNNCVVLLDRPYTRITKTKNVLLKKAGAGFAWGGRGLSPLVGCRMGAGWARVQ